uniref:SEL1-like repeat protein n=1 Tax=Herbaspirillum lusitanum TaxID=213312 RepID=UPI0038BC5014
MIKTLFNVLFVCGLFACTREERAQPELPPIDAVKANLEFTCTHQVNSFPVLNSDADQLFSYARYLEKRGHHEDGDDIARYYRIAVAHGHYKANGNLQRLISEGSARSPYAQNEVTALASQLIGQGIPGGYYDIGHYLEHGYGFKRDREMALRYFRKAADLGSPEAQFYIAEILAPADIAPDVAKQMRQCAMDQGHLAAANTLGINLTNDSHYTLAVEAFQTGVKNGDPQSAFFLQNGFNGPLSSERLFYLALAKDSERSWRYKLIGEFLDRNDGRNPKVPDIDQIVPLPPAKLPPWDGTFQWQKEQDAAVPPEKPSDELINRLSKEKNLDPATGLLRKLPH